MEKVSKYFNGPFVATKPVFGVSYKVGFKPVCSATETIWKIEISLEASLDMILSNKRMKKALIRLRIAQAGLRFSCRTIEDIECSYLILPGHYLYF